MSAVPPPGYPMTEFGKIVFAGVRKQAPPSIRFSMQWWLNWFGNGPNDREMREWVAAEKRRTPHSVVVSATEVLIQFGDRLAERDQSAPAEQEDAQDYNVQPLVTTMQGWSIWRGQHDIPMVDSEWQKVVVSYLQWCCREIVKGNMGTRALDIALAYMVLPAPKDRKYPNLSAPAALTDMAQEAWHLWKVSTGGNEPMAIYGRASMKQWQAQHDRFNRLDAVLGGAERTLRFASLQEPILRLQEKLDEFGAKRDVLAQALRVYSENEEAASRALSPEEQAEVADMQGEFYHAQKNLYDTLPKHLWQGDAPSNLAGWVTVVGVGALLAIGLIGAVAVAISVIDTLIARQRGMNLQGRIERELKAMAAQAETNRQECRFTAGAIQDPTRRAQIIAQCDRDAQRTLAEIAKQQARVAETAVAISRSKPQQAQGTEQSAVYIALGVAAWFGLRWVRKRV